jgi:hypothetical protein
MDFHARGDDGKVSLYENKYAGKISACRIRAGDFVP